ncbi:putative basic-leucine zipper transcription factor [Cavenderia fasciculata]|uniref:Basic-leucine zipper transcription factor n=1 Tax=Cavenderia fasciculata TaxID=261658 RepID=F4PJQ3_CACFS|nr:putative basic-leucine zipper transcription factor [Cavenderia fasciculata]EGG23827.1 putative basic-leucine zipper transcription factor [Cavenderia fasciculata]|eukprot:XP_004361678.1 putative basic-leucine zipper transcription factor [Cavenderia fasciculata]
MNGLFIQTHNSLPHNNNNVYQQQQGNGTYYSGLDDNNLFSLFGQPDKDGNLMIPIHPDYNNSPMQGVTFSQHQQHQQQQNNQHNNNNHHHQQQHQQPPTQQQQMFYTNVKIEDSQNSFSNGLVPDSMNHQMKHYFVPDTVFELPIGAQNQLNITKASIPIPKTPQQLSQQQQQINQNNNNQQKKKDEEKIKKRKFITTTPVKNEHGTTLVPTTDNGGVNAEEEKNLKRQRRLVKNREAAQLFRQRQKAYIQDLEKKVSDLTSNNSEIRARAELLNSENKLIREQLMYLRNFVTQAVSFSFPKSGSGSPTSVGSPVSPGSMPNAPTLPPGILPPSMMNLQNPVIMSAIAEASKSETFRNNISSMISSIPSPSIMQSPIPTSSNSQQVPFLNNNNNNNNIQQQQQQQSNNINSNNSPPSSALMNTSINSNNNNNNNNNQKKNK